MILAILLGLGTMILFVIGLYFIFVVGPNMVEQVHTTSDAPLLWIFLGFLFIFAGLGLAALAVKALDNANKSEP